jgi:hypothetical protein
MKAVHNYLTDIWVFQSVKTRAFELGEKPLSVPVLPNRNSTQTALETNPGFRSEKSDVATNSLSYGTTIWFHVSRSHTSGVRDNCVELDNLLLMWDHADKSFSVDINGLLP